MAYFIGIIAHPGDGKTNFLTAILEDVVTVDKRGVAANYNLKFPYTYVTFQEIVDHSPKIQGKVVGIDEIGEIADAYDFNQDFVRDLTKTIRQGRKDEATYYYTIQDFNILPPRLRRATGEFYLPKDLDRNAFDHSDPRNFGRCKSQFHITRLDENMNKISEFLFNGKPTRDLYDTRQKIDTFKPMQNKRVSRRTQWVVADA